MFIYREIVVFDYTDRNDKEFLYHISKKINSQVYFMEEENLSKEKLNQKMNRIHDYIMSAFKEKRFASLRHFMEKEYKIKYMLLPLFEIINELNIL
jgi:hypothetical protein